MLIFAVFEKIYLCIQYSTVNSAGQQGVIVYLDFQTYQRVQPQKSLLVLII